jgi:hypothetical protein
MDVSERVQAIEARLSELEVLDLPLLRKEWRKQLRREPPRLSRDLTLRALAYAIQEEAFGGLSRQAAKRLKGSIEGEGEGPGALSPGLRLSAGARLVREWRGRTHIVEVFDQGFLYEGVTYKSLSEVARRITGAHWSGPRFFGLSKRQSVAAQSPSASPAGAGAGSPSTRSLDNEGRRDMDRLSRRADLLVGSTGSVGSPLSGSLVSASTLKEAGHD